MRHVVGYVPPFVKDEIAGVVERAIRAGAEPPLEYQGVGMTSIVLCDASGRAFKVARAQGDVDHRFLRDEADWLWTASTALPAGWVGRFIEFDEAHLVIIRECVVGRRGGWGDAELLHARHKEIERQMLPHGWTAPEFKEDSYVLRGVSEEDYRAIGSPALVDASMAQRVGPVLVRHALAIAHGQIPAYGERLNDLAYTIYREAGPRLGTIERAEAARALQQLEQAGATEWTKLPLTHNTRPRYPSADALRR